MTIRTIQLSSTALLSATYDSETQDLQITFANGGTYDFHGVPPEIVDGLENAGSAGKYYHQFIKDRYS
jgi:KTSC domain